jgi:sensor histidine kinase regulating citrate/malate metabolism
MHDSLDSVPPKFWLAFLLFPVISIFIILLIFENEIALGRFSMSPYITIASSGILLMNLSILFLIRALAQNIQENNKLNIEKERLSYQHEYYSLLLSKQQEIRTLWHDLKHHFVIINLYAKENESEKIIEYLGEIEKDISQTDNVVQTGNFIIDSIINQKIQYAFRNNIQICVNARLYQKLDIDLNDLCIVIANALDNAIEAVISLKGENPEDKIIRVDLDAKNGHFIFTVANQFDTIRLGQDNMPVTTKKEFENHGFGIKSIEKTAQKYNGHICIETENKTFTLSVVMEIQNSK